MAERRLARLGPDPAELVPAALAQDYLQRLRAAGVGYRQAARLAGIAPQLVLDIRKGDRAVIRADVQGRILNVRAVLARGAHVMAWRSRRLLDALEKEGYQRQHLARQLGLRTRHLKLHHRRKITVMNALKVRVLFDRITEDTDHAAAF